MKAGEQSNENLKWFERPSYINILLIFTYGILFVLKFIISDLTNSIALQADGFDNLTDVVMYAAALIGLVFVNKKPNERFPYGYYRLENIISLLFSFFIFLTAYNLFLESIGSIMDFIRGNPRIIQFSPSIFLFLIISLIISFSIVVYLKIIGKKTKAPIVESEASEKLFDVLTAVAVIIGFIGASVNLYILDSIIGLIIVVFIVKGGYDIFISSIKVLLDAVVEFEKRTELINMVLNIPIINKIDQLELRAYGKYIFLELEISLNKDLPLHQLDSLKNKIDYEIKTNFPKIFKTIIIIQSPEKPIVRMAVPLEENKGDSSIIGEHFGESSFFALVDIQESKVDKFEVLPNDYKDIDKRKGLLISEWLVSKKIDKIYLKKELKKGPELIFESNFVKMEITDLNILNELIEKEAQE